MSDYQALENKDMLLEVRNDLMKTLNDESRRHPLVQGDLQLCQMMKEELSSLRMTRLIYLFIYLFISRFVHIEYIQVLEQKDIASPTRFNHLPNPINLETV